MLVLQLSVALQSHLNNATAGKGCVQSAVPRMVLLQSQRIFACFAANPANIYESSVGIEVGKRLTLVLNCSTRIWSGSAD